MKRLGIIGLVLLLWGCGSVRENEISQSNEMSVSSIYLHQGELHNLSVKVFYPLRLTAVNEGEIEKAVLVKGNQDEAVEITVSDQAELDKIADYFKTIKIGEDITSLGPGTWYDFEITLKGKEPLYFRFNHIGLCTGQCVYTDQFAQLEALAANLKGEEKAVKGMPVDAYFTQVLSWTDVMPVIPNYYAASPKSEDSIIIDSWAEIKNPKHQLLRIANYIDENFESVADITDTKTLTAGLIQQAEKYDCFEEPENVCRNRENNDLLYFPAGKPGSFNVHPDVYKAVPYSSVEQAGKEIFGDDYTLPDLDDGSLLYQSMQGYAHSAADKLFFYHLPYEYWLPVTQNLFIMDEQQPDNLSIFTFYKAASGYWRGEDMPLPQLQGKNGFIIKYSFEDSASDLINKYQDHFEAWEYVIMQEGDHYRLISGRCLNRSEPAAVQVDPEKPDYYFDEQGLLKINLASRDAAYFNEWVVNQKDQGNVYKVNVHDGLLSVWIEGVDNNAVVFDVADGKTLTTTELIQKLKVDPDRIVSAIKAMPEYSSYIVDLDDVSDKIGEFKTSKLFINSQGLLAYDFNYFGIILFEWGEVR